MHAPLPDLGRRRWLHRSAQVALATCTLAALAPARAGYNIWLGEYTIERQLLQQGLAERFPLRLRYMELFRVTLSNPRLGLDAKANRTQVTSDVQIENDLLLARPVQGLLALSSGLKYDAPARALRLHEPRADQVEIKGMSGEAARQLQAVSAAVAAQVLADYALYTFKPEELTFNGQVFQPGEITVLEDGIKVKVD
ncbi:DUF1439 domain-containing protein [Comamonas sp. BIGb0124]|uniref:DUF1439 domain-containing protein n=1 Tax=Comamonas sp. BIGb0124 TaxID=2485130 RepID=UPI000F4AF23B|nr:DUF1439 domain-containing protein [Comamonas sp. BIGb0124]